MGKKDYQKKKRLQELTLSVIESKTTEELKSIDLFLSSLMRYRKLDKLYKTFIQGPIKAIDYNEQDKIYCDFNLDGTVTGRLSCTSAPGEKVKGGKENKKGVSFHTLAKKDKTNDVNVRNAYISPRDQYFIAADYSTMELRVVAQIANVRGMIQSFLNKEDLHSDTAKKIYNLEEVDKKSKERECAKTANFLIVYGGGAPNLAEAINIPMSTAEWIINRHKEVYPEIPAYTRKVTEFMEGHEYVETIFGRRRHLPDINSDIRTVRLQAIRQGFNTLVQSPASDILLCADEGIRRDIHTFKHSKIRANVHDSLEATATEEELDDLCSLIYYHMVENPVFRELGIEFNIPFEVELEVGTSFGSGELVIFDSNYRPTNLEEVKNEVKRKAVSP